MGQPTTYTFVVRHEATEAGTAPRTGSGDYGFGIFSQQTDGSIAVEMTDYQSLAADCSFHFAVKADGAAAP